MRIELQKQGKQSKYWFIFGPKSTQGIFTVKKVFSLVCMFLLVSCVVQQQPGWAVGKVYTIPESEMGQYKKRSNSSADRKKKTAQTVVPKAQRGGLGDGLSVAGRTIISTTNGQSMEWKLKKNLAPLAQIWMKQL